MPSAHSYEPQQVTAFGRVWILDGTSAAGWLNALQLDDVQLTGIFPGFIGDEYTDDMLDLWLEFPDAEQRCQRVAQKALARESGLDWVWAWNLMRMCLGSWIYINGVLLRQGVTSSDMSLRDWLHAAYTLILEGKDADGRVAFESELMIPPAGVALKIPAKVQHQGALAFAAD